ncbi:MAG: hypothetical protein WC997_10575 [Porticoccaceae bacterium]
MKKIAAASPQAQSADLVAGNIEQLKTLFPELITEGANGVAVNVDVLKALVGDASVTNADEKYGLNWRSRPARARCALARKKAWAGAPLWRIRARWPSRKRTNRSGLLTASHWRAS